MTGTAAPRMINLLTWGQGDLMLLFVAVAVAALSGRAEEPTTAASPGPLVEIADGKLRGLQSGPVVVFKGIPFARPPIGELRWREPQPVVPWPGVREATRPGSRCTQSPAGLDDFLGPLAEAYGARFMREPVQSSEDCLYLNVWTSTTTPRSLEPVMVWLHGGSNVVGSGSQSTYDGAGLASHGVVLVTINYRLGVLGSFSHPELTAESPHHSSGNYGLLDQLAALQWVHKNISHFGGDPDNVTLFGESAGAIDAALLMTSPLSKGLFKRVISESGPALSAAKPLSEAEAAGAAVGRAAPGHSTSTLQNLRALPATEVVELANRVIPSLFPEVAGALILDGWVLPRSPQQAFARGALAKVDLLIGLNARELSAFRVTGAARASKEAMHPGKVAPTTGGQTMGKLTDAMAPLYGGWTYPAIAWYLAKMLVHRDAGVDQAGNDVVVACPLGAMATLVTAAGQRAYVYRFERVVPGKGAAALGAFHSLEVPYVFRAFAAPEWGWLPVTSADLRLSVALETYWTQFAKTGNPNSAGLAEWPAWNNDAEPYLEIDPEADIKARQDFSPIFCHLSPQRLRERLK
jgi:para-nitrobenzyl esterase